MGKEIDLRAKLILATEDMVIEEGQYLIVYGSVCHGVYTGKIMAEHEARPVRAQSPALPAPSAPHRLLTGPAPKAAATSKAAEKAAAKAAAKAELATQRAEAKAAATAALKSAGAGRPRKNAPKGKLRVFTEAQVIAAMRKIGKPVISMKLGDRMGVERGDSANRARLNAVLVKLKARGVLTYVDERDAGFRKLTMDPVMADKLLGIAGDTPRGEPDDEAHGSVHTHDAGAAEESAPDLFDEEEESQAA